MQVSAEKSVTYRIEYNGDAPECARDDPAPLVIIVPDTYSAMDIMEIASNQGEEYQFTATYFGQNLGGYFINSVNGVFPSDGCFWFAYIQAPGGNEFRPFIGVTNYIPGDGFVFVLRYETNIDRLPPMLPSTVAIEYPDLICNDAMPPPAIDTFVFQGGSALTLMENAVSFTQSGSLYRFSASYSSTEGFVVETLDGVANTEECRWVLFIMSPEGIVFHFSMSPADYEIPGSGYTIIWRFMRPIEVTTTSYVAKETTSILGVVILLFISIVWIVPRFF